MEYKTGSINKIIPLVDEMGEERFKQYMRAYLELGKDKPLLFRRVRKIY